MRGILSVLTCSMILLVAAGVCAAAPWYVRTVDSPGRYGSLAVDANRYPHISYFDVGGRDLKYAAWNGSGWDIQAVDTEGDVGYWTSLALGPTGHARMSYYDLSNGKLKYAAWNGSTWQMQTADSSPPYIGQHNSLALDAAGHPHISYYAAGAGHDLRYAASDGSSWDVQVVDTPGQVGLHTSIALDTSGRPHISYYHVENGDLKYANWNGTDWDIQTVDGPDSVGAGTSLALDAGGHPHITYLDDTNDDLKYAVWNGTSWSIQTVDSAGAVGFHTSLVLDAQDHAHISYMDWTNNDLKYAAWNGSSWEIQAVDSAVNSWDSFTSLALDADGYVHIAYHDSTSDDVKYATTRPPAVLSHELPTTGYYMISSPLVIGAGATVHDLLCDDLGHAPGSYYVWRWDSGAQSYYSAVTPPGCTTVTTQATHGVWLLAPAATIDLEGTLPTGDHVIALAAGWNIVGPHYGATMDSLQVDNAGDRRSLAEAASLAWVLATFYYSHDGTGRYSTLTINQTPADTLSFWYGYWVLAALDCSLIVPEPAGGGGTAATALQPAPVQLAWAFDIQATSGSSGDSITMAAADGASDGFDGFGLDRPKPPAAPGEGRLQVVLRGKGRRGRASPPYNHGDDKRRRGTEPPPYNKAPGRQMPWSAELAMETKGTEHDATEWHFTITGGVDGEPVTLSWPELSRLPKDRIPILTDRDTGRRTFMRSRAQYELGAPGADSSRSFSVTVKSAPEGALLISGLTAVPTRSGTWDIGFNISADAAVTARVHNVAGRLVADVASGQQLTRGRVALAWNARNISGTTVPSGTYVLGVTARTEHGEQTSAVTLLRVGR